MEKDVCDLLSSLIRIPSVNPPGNEALVALFLKEYLTKRNLVSRVQNLGNGRANFVADIGPSDGIALLFDGHLDVVPAGGTWRLDPFSGQIIDDVIYGRGSSDMKGGLAAMVIAFCELAEENFPLKGTLRLLFVADEETENLGAISYFASVGLGSKKQYAIIGEPTELQLCRGHLGVVRYWIHFHGKSAHASFPEKGRNAISLATQLIPALDSYHKQLRKTFTFFGSPSCTVTLIEGGEKQNSVPSE